MLCLSVMKLTSVTVCVCVFVILPILACTAGQSSPGRLTGRLAWPVCECRMLINWHTFSFPSTRLVVVESRIKTINATTSGPRHSCSAAACNHACCSLSVSRHHSTWHWLAATNGTFHFVIQIRIAYMGMHLSCNFVNVYTRVHTIAYRVHARIPNTFTESKSRFV